MDNNLNNQPAEPMPNMQIPTDNIQVDKKGNSTMWIILIILVVVVLVAGVYLYMRNQASSGVPTNTPTTTSSVPSLNSFNSELNSADTTNDTSDFDQLDQDLKNL